MKWATLDSTFQYYDCERGEVKGRVHNHWHPDAAREREDSSVHKSHNRALFGSGESLLTVMGHAEQSGREQHDKCLGPYTGSEKLAEALEHVALEHGLCSESRDDSHGEDGTGKGGTISGQVVIRLIDRRCAKKRHHDRLPQQFERDTERKADGHGADPALGAYETDLPPRRARARGPQHHQHSAERRKEEISGKYDQNREDSERP